MQSIAFGEKAMLYVCLNGLFTMITCQNLVFDHLHVKYTTYTCWIGEKEFFHVKSAGRYMC